MVNEYMEAYKELQSLRLRVNSAWRKVFALADKLSDEEIDSLPLMYEERQKIRRGKRMRNPPTDQCPDLPWLT